MKILFFELEKIWVIILLSVDKLFGFEFDFGFIGFIWFFINEYYDL